MFEPSECAIGHSQKNGPASLIPERRSVVRRYRIALVASLALNALLVTAFWLYVHFAGTLSMIEDVVGFFN
jgi:hypothetical protein